MKYQYKHYELQRQVIVTTSWEGFHSWEDAPDPVSFLRNRHRHTFECEIGIPVDHNDRDKEFIMVKRELDEFIQAELRDQNKSCEQYAEAILKKFHAKYAEVWEDGENGARIEMHENLALDENKIGVCK